MRCYHFGNFYMSSIQQGIQAAHCQMELVLKYDLQSGDALAMLWDWMHNHKTMICLNGGMLADMKELWEVLDVEDNPYPYAKFHESDEAMGGMLTNIAIVLPERIYEAARFIRKQYNYLEQKTLSTVVTDDSICNTICYKLDITSFEYDELEKVKEFQTYEYTHFEYELINKLNSYSLAK